MSKKLRVGSHFSGIGSVNEAILKFNLDCEVVYSIEYEEKTQQAYKDVYNTKNVYGDITNVNPKDLPVVDIIVTSPPCQAFSKAGLKKGLADPNGRVMFETFKIIEYQRPKMVLLENVPDLISMDNGNVLRLIIRLFHLMGYSTKHKKLIATDYDSPQGRERVFLVAYDKREKIQFRFPNQQKVTHNMTQLLCDDDKLDDVKYNKIELIEVPREKGRYLTPTHIRKGVTFGLEQRVYLPDISSTLMCKESSYYSMENGAVRTLTIRERFRLQAYTEQTIDKFLSLGLVRSSYLSFTGNTINVNVMGALLKTFIKTFDKFTKRGKYLNNVNWEKLFTENFSDNYHNAIYGFSLNYVDIKVLDRVVLGRDSGNISPITKQQHLKLKQEHGKDFDTGYIPKMTTKEKQVQSAYATHKIRSEKTLILLKNTIKMMIEKKIRINQYQIIKHSQLNKKTVKKYLKDIDLKELQKMDLTDYGKYWKNDNFIEKQKKK